MQYTGVETCCTVASVVLLRHLHVFFVYAFIKQREERTAELSGLDIFFYIKKYKFCH